MATQHESQLHDFYQRKRAASKAHGTAVGAVYRTLLLRIYVALREQRPYVIRE